MKKVKKIPERAGLTPRHSYSSAEERFLKENIKGRSYSEVRRLFNERFGLELTFKQITSKVLKMGLHNGIDPRIGYHPLKRDFSKYGLKPGHNNHPLFYQIGTEVIKGDGFMSVKVANPDVWKYKHYIIWEAAYGPKPEGHKIIFADGNKLNFDLDNLLLVSKAESTVMNFMGLITNNADLTKLGKSIADLKLLINKQKREAKELA